MGSGYRSRRGHYGNNAQFYRQIAVDGIRFLCGKNAERKKLKPFVRVKRQPNIISVAESYVYIKRKFQLIKKYNLSGYV